MDWIKVYKDEIDKIGVKKYIENKIKCKKNYIKIIEKYAKNKTIIETGCGTGIISLYLAQKGYKVVAIDNDEKMINLAKQISSIAKENENIPEYLKEDIINCKFDRQFDVAFSNGVYEHFNDKTIINTIKNIFNFCQYNILSVPSNFFNKKEATYGNERFMSKKDWLKIFDSANFQVVEIKRFDDRKFVKKIIQVKKWFKNKPFIIFVLKKS